MYNVRVSAEFSSASNNDPLYISGTARREGDLSEIQVADIYRRKLSGFSSLSDSRDRKRIFSSCYVSLPQLIRVESGGRRSD